MTTITDTRVANLDQARAEAYIEHAYLVSYDIAQDVCDLFLRDARRTLHAAIMANPAAIDYWPAVVHAQAVVDQTIAHFHETIGLAWRSRCADMAAL